MRQRPGFLRSITRPEEGWLSLIFLCAVTLSSVWSVQEASWVDDLEVLPKVTLLAVLCGFVLAKAPLPGILLHPFGLTIGLATVVYAVATTLHQGTLRSSVLTLWGRFDRWLGVTATGGISTDNLLFLLLLSGIVWLMGYYGAWSVFRSRGPWWVILTSGSILVVNLSYARTLDIFALLYLLSAMLLVVRLNVAVQQEAWQRSGVQYSADFPWQLVRSSVAVAVVVVLATWFAPSSSASRYLADTWTNVSGPWQNMEAEFSRLFGGLRPKEQVNASGFGKTLSLRGATPLADTPVLAVTDSVPRYLRGVVYDRYTGQGWLAPERGAEQMLPNDPRLIPRGGLLQREEVTTTLKVLQPRGTTLMAPAQPLRVSMPFAAEYAVFEGSGGEPDAAAVDVSVLRSSLMMRPGQAYQVASSISKADARSLRSAGTKYPEWVSQQYLSLPRPPSSRVVALARRITQDARNPYDRAMAVQNYLRGYPYSEVVPPPPPGRDAVDFFLFDARVGYCDYYASAMVVMLRFLGVPARVVSGYSPGEYDPGQQAYVVRDSNAHSWPEVYFPGYGWVEFEPTASNPAPVRPEQSPDEPPPAPIAPIEPLDDLVPAEDIPDPDILPPSTSLSDLPQGENALIAAGRAVVPVVGVLVLAYLALQLLWRRAFRELSPAEAAYGKMTWLAGWVGLSAPHHQTPFEHARTLSRLVPDVAREVQLIAERFVRQRFGRKTASLPDTSLDAAWQRVRVRLVRIFWRRFR